jgi:hypothetical protein
MKCGVLRELLGTARRRARGVDRRRATRGADAAATVPVMVAVETTSAARPDWHTTLAAASAGVDGDAVADGRPFSRRGRT